MATNVTSTTFLSEYNDDYRDSDHYHRVLFNNGRALQARELTQLQTIIQKEIERLSKFVVSEGSIFNNSGTLASGTNAASYTYIKVSALPSGYAAMKGKIVNQNDIVFGVVKAIVPDNTATSTPPGTVILRLTGADGTANSISADVSNPKTFSRNTTVTIDGNSATILNTSDAVGKSSLIETPPFDTYAAGHLVTTEAQTLVLNATSNTYSGIVGFKVTEQVITASDNVALYDNSGSTPNLTSPGADRLKITLTLTKKEDTDIDDTFYEVFKIVNGNVTVLKTPDKTLGRINQIVAARTESITGDFIENKTGGMFDLTINKDSASTNFLSVEISSGTAFVNGNRIERDYNIPFRVRKPNDPADTQNLTSPQGLNIHAQTVDDPLVVRGHLFRVAVVVGEVALHLLRGHAKVGVERLVVGVQGDGIAQKGSARASPLQEVHFIEEFDEGLLGQEVLRFFRRVLRLGTSSPLARTP